MYWGATDVGLDFNDRSFINCHSFENLEDAIVRMIELWDSPTDLSEILAQPWLLDCHLKKGGGCKDLYRALTLSERTCSVKGRISPLADCYGVALLA